MRVDGRMIEYIELLEDLSRDCESAADDHYCAALVASETQAPVPAVQATPTASETAPSPVTFAEADEDACDSAKCIYERYYALARSHYSGESAKIAPIRMTERQAD
jgi:hypothetical protein